MEHTGTTITDLEATVEKAFVRNQPGRIQPFCTCDDGHYCSFCAAKEDYDPTEDGPVVFTTNGIEPPDEFERRTR